jgi:hypothetical protein
VTPFPGSEPLPETEEPTPAVPEEAPRV